MSATSGLGGAPFASAFFRSRRRRTRTMPLVQQFRWADTDDAEQVMMNDWMWPVIIPGETSGQTKVYNGSAWVGKPVKVWDGSAWVVKPVKRWNGSSWVTTPY